VDDPLLIVCSMQQDLCTASHEDRRPTISEQFTQNDFIFRFQSELIGLPTVHSSSPHLNPSRELTLARSAESDKYYVAEFRLQVTSNWGKALKSTLPFEMPFASPSVSASVVPGLVWSDDHFAQGVANEYAGPFHNLGASASTGPVGIGVGWNAYISADPETGAPGLMTPNNVAGLQIPVGGSAQPYVEAHAYASYSRVMFGLPPNYLRDLLGYPRQ
jgi:hypothetical protein